MERLNYDAVTLGPWELANWRLVTYLLSESRLSLVTTNLEVKRDYVWQPVGAPHLLITRGGIRFGILGLIPESDVPEWVLASEEESVRVVPLIAAAREACSQLRSQADLVVALVGMHWGCRPRLPRFLFRDVPEIDIVIAGPGICRVGDKVLARSGMRGTSLGVADLLVSPSGTLVSAEGHTVDLTPAHAADSVIAADAAWVVDQSLKLQEERREWRRKRWEARRRKYLSED